MKRARVWARIADDIRPLREPSTIGKALTEEEKQRLLKTAMVRPEWDTAYLAAILCLNTTARGCELKGLQWSDVDLFARTLTIRKSKTKAGERTVPLTDVACSALARLRARAELFGAVEPSPGPVPGVAASVDPPEGVDDVDALLHAPTESAPATASPTTTLVALRAPFAVMRRRWTVVGKQ